MEKRGKENEETKFSILESKSSCNYSICKSAPGHKKNTSLRIQRLLKTDYLTVFYEEKENNELSAPRNLIHVEGDVEIYSNNVEIKEDCKQFLKENSARNKHNKGKMKMKRKSVFRNKMFSQKKCKQSKNLQKNALKIKVEPQEFLQNDFCFKIAPELPNCSECLSNSHKSRKMRYFYCSFINYRKLFISENGIISHSGFLEASDSTREDRQIWLPQPDTPPKILTIEDSEKILFYLENLFHDLMEKEEDSVNLHIGSGDKKTWKKLIQSTEESCNICAALIFNIHWICPQCAFCICIDCYEAVKEMKEEEHMKNYYSLRCHNHQPHELAILLLTEIIPNKILQIVHHIMKTVCKQRKICSLDFQEKLDIDKSYASIEICKKLMKNSFLSKHTINKTHKFNEKSPSPSLKTDPVKNSVCFENFVDKCDKYDPECFSSVLCSPTLGLKPLYELEDEDSKIDEFSVKSITDHFINLNTDSKSKIKKTDTLNFFHIGYSQIEKPQESILTHVHTVAESLQLVKDVPHTWLNNGKLLLLHEANITLFQDQWRRHQPVIVSDVHKNIVSEFWHPRTFSKVVGKAKAKCTIKNCKTGRIMRKLCADKYWEGFESMQGRAKDTAECYIPLKLKDWPPAESFDETLRLRLENLMKVPPLHMYTSPEGVFNLAARLPPCFIEPDFGLKIESGYSLALHLDCATTNLHVSVNDTVNILVHASLPNDAKDEHHLEAAFQEVYESGCDSITKQRYFHKETPPGALWDIYNVSDGCKIRAFLFKIATEHRAKLKGCDDPLQNHNWYLNKTLKKRLSNECDVNGCIIVQHVGDAIFIPAGTPYQVRNLRDCVNVTKQFISPESISNSLKLVQESRTLKNLHPKFKQELPVNHIIYHSVKDALSCLLRATVTDDIDPFLIH